MGNALSPSVRAWALALLVPGCLCPGTVAHADSGAQRHPIVISIGALAGSAQPDARLADYQWDLRPRTAWGIEGLIGQGRFVGGVRAWRAGASQYLDPSTVARVHSTRVELVGKGRLAQLWCADVLAIAGVGRIHLGYSPDEITIDAGAGAPMVVRLVPIDEWSAGGGLGVRRSIAARWVAGVEVERGVFALETAHRAGGGIETGRETLGDWSARLTLARAFEWR